MRSDLPRFTRPRPPKIESFVDQLETELRTEIRRNPPRPRRLQRAFDRLGRLIVRPVFHGGSVAIVFVMVVLALRPQPTTLNEAGQPHRSPQIVWAEVVEVPDPAPKSGPFVQIERAPRFVAFAASSPAGDMPEPPVGLAPV
jgi:hypothetical protein